MEAAKQDSGAPREGEQSRMGDPLPKEEVGRPEREVRQGEGGLNVPLVESPASDARAVVEEARRDNAGAAAEEQPRAKGKPKAAGGHLEIAEAFGRNKDEAQSIHQVDQADSSVESDYGKGRLTVNSAAYQGVMKGRFPKELFDIKPEASSAEVAEKRKQYWEIIKTQFLGGTLLDEHGKISPAVLRELGDQGYFGQRIPEKFGGLGWSLTELARTITYIAKINPSIAGLASVHQCIGAVDPLMAYGNQEQQDRLLPKLASGEKMSAFALTEPGAGSDLSRVKTKIIDKGDHYVINGEKLFITNAVPGGMLGLVGKKGNPTTGKEEHAVVIVELPTERRTPTFEFKDYGLHPLKQVYNNGLVFKDFVVPKENYLDPTRGGEKKDGTGLAIAYNGLNAGRLALCANASGTMSMMLGNFPPWVEDRVSFGKSLAEHALVRERIGHMASRIVGTEALREWCSSLMDKGFRGEMECIIAKIFASEAQLDTSIHDFMKTHGGRSLLKGHLFGDNMHDFAAPTIYEGEGEMLKMGFMSTLLKPSLARFGLPMAQAIKQINRGEGIGEKLAGVGGVIAALAQHGFDLALRTATWIPQKIQSGAAKTWEVISDVALGTGAFVSGAARTTVGFTGMIPGLKGVARAVKNAIPRIEPKAYRVDLDRHIRYAESKLENAWIRVEVAMMKYQASLPDRQEVLTSMSQDFQNLLMIRAVAGWAKNQDDAVTRKAAEILCRDLTREVSGGKESPEERRFKATLGKDVIQGKFAFTKGVPRMPVKKPYDAENREVAEARLPVIPEEPA